MMKDTFPQKALLALAVLLTLLLIYPAVALAIQDFEWGFIDGGLEPKISFVLASLGLLGVPVVLTGLYVTKRSPHLGRILVTFGAMAMCGIGWFTIVLPALALSVLAIGVYRARRFDAERAAKS